MTPNIAIRFKILHIGLGVLHYKQRKQQEILPNEHPSTEYLKVERSKA